MPAGAAAGGLEALPALLSRLPDVERGITRILHRTASPAEFVTTLRALAGVGAMLRLAQLDDAGRIVVDASVARSLLLRQLLESAAAPEVGGQHECPGKPAAVLLPQNLPQQRIGKAVSLGPFTGHIAFTGTIS